MKKVFLAFAILITSGMFTACTELEDSTGNESIQLEILATGGEDEQFPGEEDDPSTGG